MLGGDTPEIPPRYCWSTYYYGGRFIPVDLYYAGLDGSWNDDHDDTWGEALTFLGGDHPDLYAEVYLGRLPASTVADTDLLIDKIINYVTPVDPSYMDKAMFLAEVLFPYPWDPGDTIEVNGREYAASDYVPVLIFPNPLNPKRYVVINSGLTFRAGHDRTNSVISRQVSRLNVFT